MKIAEKNGYYYLHYSYRKGKRVLTKEKYLGKKVPKNIERIKAVFLKEIKDSIYSEIYKKFNKIKENYFKEWKKYPNSIKEKIIKEIDINFTYNTNAIEGSTITLPETEKTFLSMLKEKKDLSEDLILKWHKEIFQETKPDIAGRYRDYLIRVGEYIGPDWQDINNLMKEFIKFYYQSRKINPIELSAIIHYKFEKIHPFGDGNGRIGRLISNFILYKSGFPLLIIEYKKRKSYYHALKKDEFGFVKYYFNKYLSYYKKYLK
ncbi:Fic family protein [Candidatus Woesearchaeota archaeon]|nr:Fic family protein [Candidatus Woesearchaeota archaeon]